MVIPNVHTHELYLDIGDTLYGEHLWYEGDRTGKWGIASGSAPATA